MSKNKVTKATCKSLALLLSTVLLILSIPLSAFASDASIAEPDVAVSPNIPEEDGYVTESFEFISDEAIGIVEVEELREESVKHFRLPDGTYQAVSYGRAVHRRSSEGEWTDIDNSLALDTLGKRYSTSDGRISFSNTAPEISLNENGYGIKMTYLASPSSSLGNIDTDEQVFTNITLSVDNAEARATSFDTLEEAARVDNRSALAYNNVKSGMAIEYVMMGNDVKENIILNGRADSYEYFFTLELTGLTASLTDNGEIRIYDGENVKYIIPAPYMYDAEGEISQDVDYELVQVKTGLYLLKVTADSTWINDGDRVFPVTVDPTITSSDTLGDTYIDSSNPSSCYGSMEYMRVSTTSTALIYLELPQLPEDSTVNAAQLWFYQYTNGYTGSLNLAVYPINEFWYEGTSTYQSRPTISTQSAGTGTLTTAMESSIYNPYSASISITGQMSDYYSNDFYGEYYGFALCNTSPMGSVNIVSYDFGYGDYAPYFWVNYSFDITDGVYAIHSYQYNTRWITVEMADGAVLPADGANLQQKYYSIASTPIDNFARESLFKISKVSGANRYIIRSMLDNDLSFGISGTELVIKEIPSDDAAVAAADTFYIDSYPQGFVIRPYSAPTKAVYVSSSSTADLTTIDSTSTNNKKYWSFEKYTGGELCGYAISRSQAPVAGNIPVISIWTWSTRINRNTPFVGVAVDSTGIATSLWASDSQKSVVYLHDEGELKLDIKIGDPTMSYYDIFNHYYTVTLPFEEGTYFFQNAEYNNYMQIDNNVDPTTSGAILELWDFDGANDQRWNVVHVGDGYYKIVSVASELSACTLATLDESIIQTAYIGTLNQLWNFTGTADGTFKISPKADPTYYMSAGDGMFTSDGRNVEIREDQTDNKDEWVLYKQKDYTLMYIGYVVGDPEMIPIINSVSYALQNSAQMDGNAYTSLNKDDLLVHLSSSNIFSCITHGLQTELATADGSLTVSDINSLSNDAFDNLEFVYLGACLTGQGTSNGNNLVNAIYNKGANTVLGFTVETYVIEVNLWTEVFMEELATGATVNDAMLVADAAVMNDSQCALLPGRTTDSSHRYIVGSAQIAPCS